MSKYKKDEVQTGNQDKSMSSEDGGENEQKGQTINQMLNITLEQNEKLIQEAHKIKQVKNNFQHLIDNLLRCKKELFVQSKNIDTFMRGVKSVLSSQQTAYLLILMEKFKQMEEFSVFKLWNIKQHNHEDLMANSA